MGLSINGFGSAQDVYSQYAQKMQEEQRERMGISNPLAEMDPLKAEEKDARHGGECQTCKNRKYQDGSNEMVSFKSAAHVSPTAAGAAVRAHEQEHVSNAFNKAETGNGKVLQASVTIKTAVCPECGRSYVSGGETRTQIKYYNEDNPYQKDKALQDSTKYAGMNVDAGC